VKGTVYDENGYGYTMEGAVKSVKFTTDGDVLLELEDGDMLPLANLEQVTDDQTTTGTDAQTTAKLLNQTQTLTPTTPAKGIVETLAQAFGL
jgi:hypothetical protein